MWSLGGSEDAGREEVHERLPDGPEVRHTDGGRSRTSGETGQNGRRRRSDSGTVVLRDQRRAVRRAAPGPRRHRPRRTEPHGRAAPGRLL